METTIKTAEIETGMELCYAQIVSLTQCKNGLYHVYELTKVKGQTELYQKVNSYCTPDRKNALATFNRRVKKMEQEINEYKHISEPAKKAVITINK